MAKDQLIKPSLTRLAPPPVSEESPRPWPPAAADLPRSSALSALGTKAQAEVAGSLLPGPLAPSLRPTLENGLEPKGPWDAQPTPDGWRIPSNPSKTPVRPRDVFDIPVGTDDLGQLTVVSSCSGRIRALRLQWPEEFQEPAFSAQKAVFEDLLTRLPEHIAMHVVAEGLASTALPKLLSQWGLPNLSRVHIHPLHLHSTPELLYEPMTMWARDGAILLRTLDQREVLLLPRSFRGDGQVDPKLNRLIVQGSGAAPACLAAALPDLIVRRSSLSFEGGDVVASRRAVLIGGFTIARNMTDLRLSSDAVVEQFAQLLGLPVVVIDPQPEFHVDLGFTFLDDNTIAVADPGEGLRLVAGMRDLKAMAKITQEKQLAEKYDRSAFRLASLGYRIARLPALAGLGLTTPYFTYNNVLLENYQALKRAYMPVYDVPALDDCARQVFRQHGYGVIDMPSARLSTRLWGAIRCATGELRVT